MTKVLKILDLFAGAGGLSQGFRSIKKNGKKVFELFKAVEIDDWACETLKTNYGEERVIKGDLRKSSVKTKIIQECKGKVDLIIGGIPCQSFSTIGPRSGYGKNAQGEDPRDTLYLDFFDIVKEVLPKVILIENVKGILSKKDSFGKSIIKKILEKFERIGYNFETNQGIKYMKLNAADYGVPQMRERVILIGVLASWKNVRVKVPEKTHFPRELANKHNLMSYVTVIEAIGDLPKLKPKITKTGLSPTEHQKIDEINRNVFTGEEILKFQKKKFENHKKFISNSGVTFLEYVRPNGYFLIHHHRTRTHKLKDIELFQRLKPGETAGKFMKRCPSDALRLIEYDMTSFKDKYRRQKRDAPGTTIFAHLGKDGNRFIHPEQARSFTPREAARIQSFPDNFRFEGPMTQKFKQIGNAVPPLFSKKLGETIYETIRGIGND